MHRTTYRSENLLDDFLKQLNPESLDGKKFVKLDDKPADFEDYFKFYIVHGRKPSQLGTRRTYPGVRGCARERFRRARIACKARTSLRMWLDLAKQGPLTASHHWASACVHVRFRKRACY